MNERESEKTAAAMNESRYESHSHVPRVSHPPFKAIQTLHLHYSNFNGITLSFRVIYTAPVTPPLALWRSQNQTKPNHTNPTFTTRLYHIVAHNSIFQMQTK